MYTFKELRMHDAYNFSGYVDNGCRQNVVECPVFVFTVIGTKSCNI